MAAGDLYLVKANDDVISYCRCTTAPMAWPAQMDCPWCGCGWLFVCSHCGKPFMFARAEYIDEPIEEIGRRDLLARRNEEPSKEDVAEWVHVMRILQKGIEPGKLYAYLDGFCLPIDEQQIAFEGWAARHDLPHLPHVDALKNANVLDLTIGSERYWRERAIEQDE